MAGRDQREHVRVDASFRVRSTALDPDALWGGNVSRGGIFVKTTRFLRMNAVIRLSIEAPEAGIAIPATCRVAFIRDAAEAVTSGKPAGMGLELLDLAERDRPMLEKLLAGRHSKETTPAPPEAPETLRVVVVDDDARYRELAAEPFRKRGDTVYATSDGLEALALCIKDPPDIILSDVQMPRMDGWQLLRLIRARPALSGVPVVFLTSLGGESERLLGYQLGVDAYLPKPYDPAELLVRAHQIVRRARASESARSSRTTLRGEIEHVGLSSLLTFLEIERKTGVLLVIGNDVSRLFFSGGRLLRAEVEGGSGESPRKTAMRVLDATSGQFEFTSEEVNPEDQLGTSVTALLLEHAHLTDERKR